MPPIEMNKLTTREKEGTTRFLYVVTEGFPPTVFDSQVMDYLRLMENRGIHFDLVVFERLLELFPNWKRNRLRLQEVRSQLHGSVYFRFLVTTFLGWDFWIPRFQLASIAKAQTPGTVTVIHARTQTAAIIALGLKKRIPRCKVIFDMRGDTPAEYLLGVKKAGRDPSSPAAEKKFAKLKKIESQAVIESDAMICVSNIMKEKILGDYRVSPQKIQVVPTVASTRKFYRAPELRERLRRELQIEGKFVLIYMGSIRAYQSLENLLVFFRNLQTKQQSLHLMLITPQSAEAEPLLRQSLPAESYTLRRAAHDEMVGWLNAADAGLLLRETNEVNQVAAPTKFGEYLLCGLPVILSSGIGDFSELAENKKVGIVLRGKVWEEELSARWNELESLSKASARDEIARVGQQLFGNEQFAEKLFSLYSALAKAGGE